MSTQQKKLPVVTRDEHGRITSGTPNPGGRPKAVREVIELARENAPAIIERLTQIALTSPDEKAAVAAGREVLDRGYGRAPQTVKIDDRRRMDPAELVARARAAMERIEAEAVKGGVH